MSKMRGLMALGASVLVFVLVAHHQQAAAPAVELFQRAPSADQVRSNNL